MIRVQNDAVDGVLVIRDGLVADAVCIEGGVRRYGDEALSVIRPMVTASVSACRLPDQAMSLLGPLIRGAACYADLRLEWVSWPKLLGDLIERGGTFVVELRTQSGRCVTIVSGGERIATYSDAQSSPGEVDLFDQLATDSAGTIRVLVDREPDLARRPSSPTVTTTTADAPGAEIPVPVTASPTTFDDPNTTLSALFGGYAHASEHRGDDHESASVGAVLPELKLLVRNRLQRSSAAVEDAIDAAAKDGETVSRLAARVREMSVRGFVRSTFDQLADDMVALRPRNS